MEELNRVLATVVAIIAALYFVPTAIAMYRGHKNLAAIVAVNLLLGCTLFGWTAALAWSLMADQETTPRRRKRSHEPNPFDEPPEPITIVYSCPWCGRQVTVTPNLIGFAVTCSHCCRQFTATPIAPPAP